MNSFKKVTVAAAFVLAMSVFVPMAKADQANWETIVTFKQPVEVPGMALPPGRYMFMIFPDTGEMPHQVLIYNSTGTHFYAMVNAIPAYRLRITTKPKFTFRENVHGAPQALRTWFWPTMHYGVEFLYNHTHTS
jgi:hypothetical protein